ncbi:LuxR C-terminal-related transcriptional regulator [Amycolatopsis speibonae]|uniref:LuxR C-terminal-related transcriptional regulator n=1 Tax=Amycolatopsis speibonae TaxID=1450224 RepID=A0ABV7NPG5_9PSEU
MPYANNATRILVVEPNPVFRMGLQSFLAAEENFAVCAAVGSVDQAIEVLHRQPVDVVLYGMEEAAPKRTPAAGLARLFRQRPGYRVVVLSQGEQPGSAEAFLGSGVSAYLPKDVSGEHLVSVVRGVSGDHELVFIVTSRVGIASIVRPRELGLSSREREIILLVAEALSNAEIASRLLITIGTVKRHLRNIFVKLSAVSRIDAVNKARAAGMLPVPA